jgi:hypothetical protein
MEKHSTIRCFLNTYLITYIHFSPLLIGPPRLQPIILNKNIDKKKAEEYLFKAVIQNHSNMIYVYNHYSSSHEIGAWHSSNLASIMSKETSRWGNFLYLVLLYWHLLPSFPSFIIQLFSILSLINPSHCVYTYIYVY